MGAYDGLLKAWQSGAARIVIELMPGAAVQNALAREIQRLPRREWTMKISHVYREGK
ncbi:hypothetical protein CXB51_009357 [Gossypium anomalum]|uniref:Uncharacterized protein n=1 Tax=Gossypium anomalum TaxID=47600 RepID=A0A8J6D9P4_9ROSI|nr:hypothetical protein CXB51_009357 [Gossypium anomalum]